MGESDKAGNRKWVTELGQELRVTQPCNYLGKECSWQKGQ